MTSMSDRHAVWICLNTFLVQTRGFKTVIPIGKDSRIACHVVLQSSLKLHQAFRSSIGADFAKQKEMKEQGRVAPLVAST